jgi:hypothetical protein
MSACMNRSCHFSPCKNSKLGNIFFFSNLAFEKTILKGYVVEKKVLAWLITLT